MATEVDLQRAFHKSSRSYFEIMGVNIVLDWKNSESDILGLYFNGYLSEVEIKLSRPNYMMDFKKTTKVIDAGESSEYKDGDKILKHDALKGGLTRSNYFSFLIPEELIDKCAIPDYAGLYIYRIDNKGIGRVKKHKSPKLLHERKLCAEKKYEIAKRMVVKYWDKKRV